MKVGAEANYKGAQRERQKGERTLVRTPKTVVVPQSAAQQGDEINK